MEGRSQMEYIALDLETTGVSADRDHILEIGAAHVRDGVILGRFQTFVDGGVSVSPFITSLTGITEEMIKGAPGEREAVGAVLDFCKDLPLLGHNILFDYRFLKKAALNMGRRYETAGIDTCKIARKFLEKPEKKSLESLCSYYGIDRERCHRAYDDAVAASMLYDCLKREFYRVSPAAFDPAPLYCKVKKDSPMTISQKAYLNDLIKYHRIDLNVSLESLTKSEASRTIDSIILKYGKIKR
jgi:DNA polymerase-3 subunit alpha (Gram-positive type)